MLSFEKKLLKNFDYLLFFTVVMLNIYGLISIYIATLETTHYLKTQSIAFTLGLIAIIIITLFDYDKFGKLYLIIYVICNILLLSVLLFGTGEKQWGARSWLVIGGFSFQPAEIVKVGMIISIAKFIDKNNEKINEYTTLIKILLFSFLPIFLILMQPDFGTAIVFIFFTVIMLFIAGLDIKYFLYTFICGIISLPILWFTFKDYQKKRILVFFNPDLDASGAGYHVTQSKIAIGSGKIIGKGLSEAKFIKFGYLPEKQTDFIFSVIGEVSGLLGGLILILLYFIMIYRLITIARNAKDLFGSLIVIGITSMMVFHIIQNIGMTIGLLPVTGIPLPFISYGGTFLLTNMISIGLVLSICIRKNKLNF